MRRSQHEFLEPAKAHLKSLEMASLRLRTRHIDDNITRIAKDFCARLFGGHSTQALTKAHSTPIIKPLQTTARLEDSPCLSFIDEWKGLTKPPTTLHSYQKKAKSWMNGRRAAAYARCFYPGVIDASLRYALSALSTVGVCPKLRRTALLSLRFEILHFLASATVKLG